jgi:hypothetical protein
VQEFTHHLAVPDDDELAVPDRIVVPSKYEFFLSGEREPEIGRTR